MRHEITTTDIATITRIFLRAREILTDRAKSVRQNIKSHVGCYVFTVTDFSQEHCGVGKKREEGQTLLKAPIFTVLADEELEKGRKTKFCKSYMKSPTANFSPPDRSCLHYS